MPGRKHRLFYLDDISDPTISECLGKILDKSGAVYLETE